MPCGASSRVSTPRYRTATVPEATVPALLRARALERAGHPLLVCDDDRLTYAEADRRSAELAKGLVALGAGKGTHVGILEPNGSDFVVAALAAARIGAVVVPIPTFSTARELRALLASSDVAVLLCARSFRNHDYVARLTEVLGDALGGELTTPVRHHELPQLRHVGFNVGDTADIPADQLPDDGFLAALEADVDGCDPLAIIYTSGSSSAPKGVVHTHEAMLLHQHQLNEIRDFTPDDRLFCNSPFFWVGGFGFALLATLVAGATLICSNATDPAHTLDLLEAERPTLTNGFAASVAHLARHPSFGARDLSSMRRGNLYPIMPADVRPSDPELRHNMLGMTESGGTLTLSADGGDQPESRRGSFGRPATGFDTKVVDGELCIRGPHVMQGYYGREREQCFDADGWFHTGDLVRVDADGFVYFLGRRGSMIKTAGANVSPLEVEQAIARVAGGATAHVVGLPDAERGQLVGAVVVAAADHPVDERGLRDALAGELSSYKIPRRIVVVPAQRVPLLSSGKVDLRRLPELFDE